MTSDGYLHQVRRLLPTAPRGEGDAWRARFAAYLDRAEAERRADEPCAERESAGLRHTQGIARGLFLCAGRRFALGPVDRDVIVGIFNGAGAPAAPNERLARVLAG